MSTDISEHVKQMQQYIKPLNINGLRGRVLSLKSSKKTTKREILIVYGHHSSIERMFGIAEALADYGNVTMPDLPGFGGMDSFYSINMKPDIDRYADYLATYIKLRYRRKKVTILGMSFGFVIATRMLQRYPDLVGRVDLLISLVGFTHSNDFSFSPARKRLFRGLTYTVSKRVPALLFRSVALHPSVIRAAYSKMPNARSKFTHLEPEEVKQMLDFEVVLWRINDVRTHAYTNHTMFLLDNCKQHVGKTVHHIAVAGDQYFDRATVEQHMQVTYADYVEHLIDAQVHAPSIVASKDDAQMYIPDTIKKVLL